MIERIGSADQTGVIADGATWRWTVVPRRPGQLTLTATLTAVLRDDGTARTRDEPVVSQDIVVVAVPQTPSKCSRAGGRRMGRRLDTSTPR